MSTEVFVWGRGGDGQLGLGRTGDAPRPTRMELLPSDGEVVSIAAGSGHTVILMSDGSIYSCGRGDDGRLGHGDLGWVYSASARARATPRAASQQLPPRAHSAAPAAPQRPAVPRCIDTLSDVKIVQVCCGSYHTAACDSEGRCWTWGGGLCVRCRADPPSATPLRAHLHSLVQVPPPGPPRV